MPILNGDQWCDWLDRRQAVRIEQQVAPDGSTRVVVRNLAGQMSLMLPVAAGAGARVTVAGDEVAVHREHRLMQDYLWVPLRSRGGAGAIDVEVTGLGR